MLQPVTQWSGLLASILTIINISIVWLRSAKSPDISVDKKLNTDAANAMSARKRSNKLISLFGLVIMLLAISHLGLLTFALSEEPLTTGRAASIMQSFIMFIGGFYLLGRRGD